MNSIYCLEHILAVLSHFLDWNHHGSNCTGKHTHSRRNHMGLCSYRYLPPLPLLVWVQEKGKWTKLICSQCRVGVLGTSSLIRVPTSSHKAVIAVSSPHDKEAEVKSNTLLSYVSSLWCSQWKLTVPVSSWLLCRAMCVTAKLTTFGSVVLGWDTSGVPVAEWMCWDRLWDMSPPVAVKEPRCQSLCQPWIGWSLVGAKPVPRTMLLPTPSREH